MTSVKIKRCPREALADALTALADHVRRWAVCVSVQFDGKVYRVSIEGEGEALDINLPSDEDPV